MNKKKLLTLVLSLVLIGAVGVGATLAYFTDNDTALNTVTMGKVNIELTEPDFDSDGDGNGSDIAVVPNKLINKDPQIKVKAGSNPAYIRAKVVFGGTLPSTEMGELKDIIETAIIAKGWVKGANDDYYYWPTSVSATANADSAPVVLFDGFTIPADWTNTVAGKSVTIDITAEAIQADNFLPEGLTKNENGEISGTITGWDLEGQEIEEYTGQ